MTHPRTGNDPRVANRVTYTIALTVTVAGGTRWPAGYVRAERLASRLADAAADSPHTLDVTVAAGPSFDGGQTFELRPVRFAAANTVRDTAADRDVRDRYLDPSYRRLADLTGPDDGASHRRAADRKRRAAVACRNAQRLEHGVRVRCACLYCRPDLHLAVTADARTHGHTTPPLCPCGRPLTNGSHRCPAHADVHLVVLDDDSPNLQQLLLTAARRQEQTA